MCKNRTDKWREWGNKIINRRSHSGGRRENELRQKNWDVTRTAKLEGIVDTLEAFDIRLFLHAKKNGFLSDNME